MGKFMGIHNYLMGRCNIPKAVTEMKGPRVLFISDTPTTFYKELKRVIASVKPDYILHTGDLVDDVKLEMYPRRLPEFERGFQKLLSILNDSGAKAIYLAMGNHDAIDTVKRYCFNQDEPAIHIIEDSGQVDLHGHLFWLSHYAPSIDQEIALKHESEGNSVPESEGNSVPQWYTYGHDLSRRTSTSTKPFLLNGVEAMFVIDLDQSKAIGISYPEGTNSARLQRTRYGL